MYSLICRHHLCSCANSIFKHKFSNYITYWAARSNIQYSGKRQLTTIGPSPALQSILSRLGDWTKVYQVYSWVTLIATGPAALWLPVQFLVPISQSKVLSTVTPISPVQTSTVQKNIQMTSSLASRLSIAVAPSIGLCEVQPHSERTACLPVIQVHSGGIRKGLPRPLPPPLLTPGLQSQMTNAFYVDTINPCLVPRQHLSVMHSCSVLTEAATMCTNDLSQWSPYLWHSIATI